MQILIPGDGTFSFEEFVQVMANVGGISEDSEENEEEELRQAFRVSCTYFHSFFRALSTWYHYHYHTTTASVVVEVANSDIFD